MDSGPVRWAYGTAGTVVCLVNWRNKAMPDSGTSSLLEREWVSVRDPDDAHRRFTFDVSFLLSGFRCIYGAGCQGITGRAELGCCAHGACLEDTAEVERLERLVADDLDDETMQLRGTAVKNGIVVTDDDGERRTRVVDGGCVFLNRADHPGGPGCALHVLAVARGEHHMTHKPTVCWQLPLHRTVDERTANDGQTLEVHTIAAFERGHWGAGGADFAWYCTEDEAAFDGRDPVYRSMESELRAMVGDPVYEALAHHLSRRHRQRHRVRFLPVLG